MTSSILLLWISSEGSVRTVGLAISWPVLPGPWFIPSRSGSRGQVDAHDSLSSQWAAGSVCPVLYWTGRPALGSSGCLVLWHARMAPACTAARLILFPYPQGPPFGATSRDTVCCPARLLSSMFFLGVAVSPCMWKVEEVILLRSCQKLALSLPGHLPASVHIGGVPWCPANGVGQPLFP